MSTTEMYDPMHDPNMYFTLEDFEAAVRDRDHDDPYNIPIYFWADEDVYEEDEREVPLSVLESNLYPWDRPDYVGGRPD